MTGVPVLLTEGVRAIVRALGWDLLKRDPRVHPEVRQAKLLESLGITVVIDVGANKGQYGQGLRRTGYRGRIVSVEPLQEAFRELKIVARRQGNWVAENFAVGATEGSATINVAENLASSSFRAASAQLAVSAPSARFVGTELVQMTTLADLMRRHVTEADKVFVKVDTQGYELEVLASAGAALDAVAGIQFEAALTPTYIGQPLFQELVGWCESRGLRLAAIDSGFTDPLTGRVFEVDVVVVRDANGAAMGGRA